MTWKLAARSVRVLHAQRCRASWRLCAPTAMLTGPHRVISTLQIALPLWMATTLAARNFVSVAAPNSFSDRVRSQLNADPGAVKLRDKNPYFYEVGLHLSVLLADGSLPAALRRVLASRFSDIFDSSTNSRNEDITLMMRDLTNLERELFEAGYNAANSLYRWKTRELTRLATAEVLKRGVKRGRGDR